jgi:LmbE family N-acetylglucosaminyl deacetylase
MLLTRSSDPRPRAAVIVAHPDDETLWCGGYILSHPEFNWRIVTLCRAGDADRAPKFRQVLDCLGAEGEMADLDDGPGQDPLPSGQVEETTARLLPGNSYDLVLTHGPNGEYTQHRRHAECCRAVVELWRSGGIDTKRLWMFAYEDTCHEFGRMPIGATCYPTIFGSKSGGSLRTFMGLAPTVGKH